MTNLHLQLIKMQPRQESIHNNQKIYVGHGPLSSSNILARDPVFLVSRITGHLYRYSCPCIDNCEEFLNKVVMGSLLHTSAFVKNLTAKCKGKPDRKVQALLSDQFQLRYIYIKQLLVVVCFIFKLKKSPEVGIAYGCR